MGTFANKCSSGSWRGGHTQLELRIGLSLPIHSPHLGEADDPSMNCYFFIKIITTAISVAAEAQW